MGSGDQHGKDVEGCRTFVLECKDGRLAGTKTDVGAVFVAVDSLTPVVRGGGEHMASVFAGEQIDTFGFSGDGSVASGLLFASTGNEPCRDRALRNLRVILQHAEQLDLINRRNRVAYAERIVTFKYFAVTG